jgi:hypothetical protein
MLYQDDAPPCRGAEASAPRRWRARLAALLSAATLAGCAARGAGPAEPLTGTNAAPAPAVAATLDPLAAFVAAATPGSEAVVPLPGGQAERVRLQRAYAAASGRECREVLIGTGLAERSSLLCREGAAWVPARPLLKGGTRVP